MISGMKLKRLCKYAFKGEREKEREWGRTGEMS